MQIAGIRVGLSLAAVLLCGLHNAYFAQSSRTIYLSGHPRELNDGMDASIKSQGYVWAPIIYEDFIDPEHDGILNDSLFVVRIKELFPSSNAKGVCVLNWETPTAARVAVEDTGTAEYRDQVEQMLKALRIAKALRPGVKWGYYGLNVQEYYHRDAKWRKRSMGYLPVMKASDMLFPSLYKYYPYSYYGRAFEDEYASQNTAIILEVGKRYSKPVVPFVWPRFHDADSAVGLKSIPDVEWKNHVGQIAKTRYEGYGIAGIAVWTMDAYYLQVSNVVQNERGSQSNSKYRKENLMHYLSLAKSALK